MVKPSLMDVDFASFVPVCDYTTLPPGLLEAVRIWYAQHDEEVTLRQIRRIAVQQLGRSCGYEVARRIREELDHECG